MKMNMKMMIIIIVKKDSLMNKKSMNKLKIQ